MSGQPISAEELADARPAEYADDALALKFTAHHKGNLRYTAETGQWHVWDGSTWRQDRMLAVFDLARKICRAESAKCGDKRLAIRVASAQTVTAVERMARADPHHAAKVDQWDSDPWCINTPGGIVDLRAGTLRPARREDYCTKLAAAAPGGHCPTWQAFLSRITGRDEELQKFLQRMAGYALTGMTSEHAMFFLYGQGANGKSVFVNTICGMLGDYGQTAPIESFIDSKSQSHPTSLAMLRGARLVAASETEDGRWWAEAKLKLLTGGDRISARFMRQDFFEFTPAFKLLVAGNHKPRLRSVDEAMRRRFHLIPFTVTIPPAERDGALTEKLRSEWPGILAWAIQGCLAWQREGLTPPACVLSATGDYFEAEDALARWLEDRTEKKDGFWESASELFNDWSEWAESNGEFAGSQKRFSENLTARGYQQSRKRTGRGFEGIRLIEDRVTDGDGSTRYPRHARARNGDNVATRHNPSPRNENEDEGISFNFGHNLEGRPQ